MSAFLPARLFLASLVLATPLSAQESPAQSSPLEQRQEAMERFAMLDGEWRGTATFWRGEEAMTTVHTERVGTLLDGSIRLIEGRSYLPDGSSPFNAFAVVTYDTTTGTYTFRSETLHRGGAFEIIPTKTGFEWTAGEGAHATRYVATVQDGRWVETGYRKGADGEEIKFIEMDMRRIGDSGWPSAGAVGPE